MTILIFEMIQCKIQIKVATCNGVKDKAMSIKIEQRKTEKKTENRNRKETKRSSSTTRTSRTRGTRSSSHVTDKEEGTHKVFW